MDIKIYARRTRHFLKLAEQMLGVRARLVELDWSMTEHLKKQTRLLSREGLGQPDAIMSFDGDPGSHGVIAGVECHQMRLPIVGAESVELRLVRIVTPCAANLPDFWAIPAQYYRQFYRFLRGFQKRNRDREPPVMHPEQLQKLGDSTFGFLTKYGPRLKEFGVTLRRGVLLLGRPGNGKTMACAWLRGQCRKHGLSWTTVTPKEYATACNNGQAHRMLQPALPGVVLLDDFDDLLVDRGSAGLSPGQTILLTELGGLGSSADVVYVAASNLELSQIDPALRRPGRFDMVMPFDAPDTDLRRRLILTRWPRQLVEQLPVPAVVEKTAGLSFAELEELRKLIVMHYLEHDVWDWPRAWADFHRRGDRGGNRAPLGFAASFDAPAPTPTMPMVGMPMVEANNK